MCLIVMAYKVDKAYPLILAANRDEVMDRPAQPAHFWEDDPGLLAGRDLQAGGTWMGIARNGRFAAITNHRDLHRPRKAAPPSRGLIVKAALDGKLDLASTSAYEGFNLLYGTVEALRYHNNVQPADTALKPGIHGLSNAFLNSPWPKVERAKAGLKALLQEPRNTLASGLFTLLGNEERAADPLLPRTGLSLEMERAVSPIFIHAPGYGTRCSTVLLVDGTGRVFFEERTVGGGTVREAFLLG